MSQQTSVDVSMDRLVIRNLQRSDQSAGFAADITAGLKASPKHLFPKYFYDELGSRLFDAICLLPEYYLTRAEDEILGHYSDEIAAALQVETRLLEMGSGSASKTRSLIEALLSRQRELLYIPIDISESALETSARVLLQSYPLLRIEAYAGDYYTGLAALRTSGPPPAGRRTLALFLGSNIGNFDAEESLTFLRSLRRVLRAGDALLLGADLKKDAGTLEAAYDDSLGVTAAFNLNLLARINRELKGDFDLRSFRHRAMYNESLGRIEVYLESTRSQTVNLKDLDCQVRFAEGERIHTESSYKYDLAQLSRMAEQTGFARTRTWFDHAGRFSSNLFVAVAEAGS